jgi:acyl carrier protein
MDPSPSVDLDSVKAVLVETLGMEDRSDSITAETRLFGALPELDSLTVVELIVVLEERFGITVDGDDVTAEAFETLASLTDFVTAQVQPEG